MNPESTITCRTRRSLNLDAPTATSRPAHLSAASGLVQVGQWLYIVADDEGSLGVFPVEGDAAGTLLQVFPGTLPDDPIERKRVKPDLESLALLPPDPAWPHGALLALPSASRPNRVLGALIALDANGAAISAVRTIDLAGFFAPLRDQLIALNIEGAVITGNELILFQRGNKAAAVSMTLRFDYNTICRGLHTGFVEALAPTRIDRYDLGTIDQIPLAFTDACALVDGRIVFCAVAEDTSDPYLDGVFSGAVIGLLDLDGAQISRQRIDAPAKIEGIAARLIDDHIALLLVTDADDVAVTGLLLEACVVSECTGSTESECS